MSDSEMRALLQRANLESHGFKKEVIKQLTRQSGNNKAEYIRTVHYYKTTPCNMAYQVEQELDKLLEGTMH